MSVRGWVAHVLSIALVPKHALVSHGLALRDPCRDLYHVVQSARSAYLVLFCLGIGFSYSICLVVQRAFSSPQLGSVVGFPEF